MSEKCALSVVVLTKNEAARIARCLASVAWADEVVVVDDESTDDTVTICRTFTGTILRRKMDLEGRHRNWAYAQARHEWVLSLDADEVVTPGLRDEITRVLAGNPLENGFTIPRRNFIGDYWVRHGGWYPSPQLKLFRREKFRYEEVAVHPRAIMQDPCGHLKGDLLHYSYRDIEDFLAKLNNQTTREAQKWFGQKRPMTLRRFLWRTIDRFLRSYVGKQGFRDGYIGYVLAYFAALYQWISFLKYQEIVRSEKRKMR